MSEGNRTTVTTAAVTTAAVATVAAERIARDSYGRLLAHLAAAWRDIASAEDALSEALEAALTFWPERGVPENPTSWLATVARRRLLDHARRRRVAANGLPAAAAAARRGRGAAAEERPPARGAAGSGVSSPRGRKNRVLV